MAGRIGTWCMRALVVSIASAALVSPVWAATQATTEVADKGLEFVVVTAQRREAIAQTMPISMSALGGDQAVTRGATLQLSVWSRNLLSEEHIFSDCRSGFAGFGAFGMFNEPQTFGLDPTFSF